MLYMYPTHHTARTTRWPKRSAQRSPSSWKVLRRSDQRLCSSLHDPGHKRFPWHVNEPRWAPGFSGRIEFVSAKDKFYAHSHSEMKTADTQGLRTEPQLQ